MNVLSLTLLYFFVLFMNNAYLILTVNHVNKMNLHMKKEKNGVKDTFIYNARSKNQEKYMDYLNDDNLKMIIAVGPAGTGKTLFACLKAINQLRSGEINKLVITRPVVTVEEEIGFLPGNIVKKMDPWTRPIFDLFLEFFSKTELDNFINSNKIEISPLAFMRGRTFKNSFIIADEMQNSSPNQMKMLTTRIGINSKMVITGDLNQSDIKNDNGLGDLINKISIYNNHTYEKNNLIKIVDFEKRDIERSEIVKKIIDIYDFDIKNLNNSNISNILNNSNNNTTTSTSTNRTSTKKNIEKKDDAALIPKHHISKNMDIFFENNF
jgi:phosphate starvation-inducible PhoH-like protein